MKSLKSFILGAFILGSTGPSFAQSVELEDLVVNLDDNVQTVVCAPESVVDEQARPLLDVEYEEGWIFDKECWYEVLRESSRINYMGSDENEYASGYVYPSELSDLFDTAQDTLKFRHTHPYGDMEKHRELFSSLDWGDWEQAWIDLKVDSAFPNDVDIDLMIWMQKEYSKISENGVLIGQISSELGVTDFYLTPEGRNYFEGLSGDECYEYALSLWENYMHTVVPESDNFVELINSYSSAMSDPYFKVEFRHYSDLNSDDVSIDNFLEAEKQKL